MKRIAVGRSGMSNEKTRDKLGKPFAHYGTNLKATLLIVLSVILGLSGGAVVGGANALAWRLAESTDGIPYLILGWVLIVVGTCVMAFAVYQFGLSFEIRRKGVRFSQRLVVVEMRWDEISLINVEKTVHVDETGRRTGRIDWEITITGLADEIHLSKTFLQMVPSVHGMVSILKMHCRNEIQLPVDF